MGVFRKYVNKRKKVSESFGHSYDPDSDLITNQMEQYADRVIGILHDQDPTMKKKLLEKFISRLKSEVQND